MMECRSLDARDRYHLLKNATNVCSTNRTIMIQNAGEVK